MPSGYAGARRSDETRHRVNMIASTFAVAVVASAALFVGTRLLGSSSEAAEQGRHRAAIGAAQFLFAEADAPAGPAAAPGRPDPIMANQPGPSSPAAPSSASSTAGKSASSRSATGTTTTRATTAATTDTSQEGQVLALVNSERAKAGCGALTVDDRLATAARAHSADMAGRNYFSHDTPEGVTVGTRVTNAGYRWSMVGENIAWGQADAAAVMQAWMDSAGHKANILNCKYRNIGIGLAYTSSKRPYWTQDFGTLM